MDCLNVNVFGQGLEDEDGRPVRGPWFEALAAGMAARNGGITLPCMLGGGCKGRWHLSRLAVQAPEFAGDLPHSLRRCYCRTAQLLPALPSHPPISCCCQPRRHPSPSIREPGHPKHCALADGDDTPLVKLSEEIEVYRKGLAADLEHKKNLLEAIPAPVQMMYKWEDFFDDILRRGTTVYCPGCNEPQGLEFGGSSVKDFNACMAMNCENASGCAHKSSCRPPPPAPLASSLCLPAPACQPLLASPTAGPAASSAASPILPPLWQAATPLGADAHALLYASSCNAGALVSCPPDIASSAEKSSRVMAAKTQYMITSSDAPIIRIGPWSTRLHTFGRVQLQFTLTTSQRNG